MLSRVRRDGAVTAVALAVAVAIMALPPRAPAAEWSVTGSTAESRTGASLTLLTTGKVLVAGGSNGTSALSSAELYDPATGTWSPIGSMATGRGLHTATLLESGRVLVAGGTSAPAPAPPTPWGGPALASAEVYDPVSGTWSAAAPMGTARVHHEATLLTNGKVLATGGCASMSANTCGPAGGAPLDSAELFSRQAAGRGRRSAPWPSSAASTRRRCSGTGRSS